MSDVETKCRSALVTVDRLEEALEAGEFETAADKCVQLSQTIGEILQEVEDD